MGGVADGFINLKEGVENHEREQKMLLKQTVKEMNKFDGIIRPRNFDCIEKSIESKNNSNHRNSLFEV